MLFHCGGAWQRHPMDNLPKHEASWQSYAALANKLLDPLVDTFGMPQLTYGFCGHSLRCTIKQQPSPGIAPALDQHAAYELNHLGKPICARLGAAVDLIYTDQSSLVIGNWLAEHTPFDRLYLYGPDRPLHISYGPEHNRQIVLIRSLQGRRIPKIISLAQLKGVDKC